MFEFSIARKYLIPKKGHLSVSLIGVMSIFVIAVIVWLLLVFLSVTEGIEKNWLQKLTALNGPIQITPTKEYYSSYYYQIDSISSLSGYSSKTIKEKIYAKISDPYLEEVDMEIPSSWQRPDRAPDGRLKDPVKEAGAILEKVKGQYPELYFQDYEMSGAILQLDLIRPSTTGSVRSVLTQASYLCSYDNENPYFQKILSTPLNKLPEISGSEVILAKHYQESGVQIGDRGYLSYSSQGQTLGNEQKIPVYVAGFYDPGIMAVGTKFVFVPNRVTEKINTMQGQFFLDREGANGIRLWFSNLDNTALIKNRIQEEFSKAGIDSYWKVSSFWEYDFAKELLRQFQSDRYLFSLIGIIILFVASSNIISLLILMVSNKKKEIGILRAMGASSYSIALIFGSCGIFFGIMGSILGISLASVTLYYLDPLVHFLSSFQGHELFQPSFYGDHLPNSLSTSAIQFILISAPVIAMISGLIPAIKASRMQPCEILRGD